MRKKLLVIKIIQAVLIAVIISSVGCEFQLKETAVPLSAPSAFAFGEISSRGFTCSWNASETATGYKLYYGTTESFSSALFYSDIVECSAVVSGLVPETAYYVWIRAYSSEKNSPVSQAYYIKTKKAAPAAPAAVTATALSPFSVKVEWSLIAGASGYIIYRSLSADGEYVLCGSVSGGSVLFFTDTGLKAETSYFYKTASVNEGGTSEISASHAAAVTPAAYLPPPATVSVSAVSSSNLIISWTKVEGGAGYKLYKSSISSGEFSLIFETTDINVLSYTDTGLNADTYYYYKAATVNENGTGKATDAVSGKTLLSALPAPSGLTVASITANSAVLSWAGSAQAEFFNIFISEAGGTAVVLYCTSENQSIAVSGLSPSSQYRAAVSACSNYADESPQSAVAVFNTNTLHLSEINITSSPVKTQYSKGETLDLSGLIVRGEYEDGSEQIETVVPADVSGFDSSKTGFQILTITLSGKTAVFSVTVVDAVLNALTVTKMPEKTVYALGEYLSFSGLEVSGTYSDGEIQIETALSFNIESGTRLLTKGSVPVVVTCSGKSVAFSVSVGEADLLSIAVTSLPSKLLYAAGESFSMSGLVVIGYYSDDTQKVLTIGTSNISGFNSNILGEKTVVVTVGTKSAQFTVSVAVPPPTNVTVGTKTSSSIVLSWTAATSATGYKIYYSTEENEDEAELYGETGSTQITVIGLTSNVRYYFWIKSSNYAKVESDYSEYVTAVPLLNAPSGLSVESSTSTSAVITWNADPGAASYKVFSSQSNASSSASLAASPQTNKCEIQNIPRGIIYYYWAAAVNEHGESVKSSVLTFIISEPVVYIAGGTYSMGNAEQSSPVHSVSLDSFYIGKYEVLQGEWESVMGSNSSYFSSSAASGEVQSRRPVECVSWYSALVYCNRRSIKEGFSPCYAVGGSVNPDTWGSVPTSNNETWNNAVCSWTADGYRLPTEAEWEFAARGGLLSSGYPYSGSSIINDCAWYNENSSYITHEAGKKLANEAGLFDMGGNIAEWCWDRYGSYSSAEQSNPRGASSGASRVYRGGYTHNSELECRVYYRQSSDASSRSYNSGLRVARTAVSSAAAPSDFTAQVLETGTVKLSWSSAEGAVSYNIYRCGTENGVYDLLKTLSAFSLSYVDSDVKPHNTYFYRISSADAGGTGVPSAAVSCTLSNPVLVFVEGGTISMGQSGVADPVHEIFVSDFYISKYETTQAEWSAVMGTNPSSFSSAVSSGEKQAMRPVENISWFEAVVYCNKKSIAEGLRPCYSVNGLSDPAVWGTVPSSENAVWNTVKCDWNASGYRLLTEAEWEYASRGGSRSAGYEYAGSSSVDDVSWWHSNSSWKTHEVGLKTANELGICDMGGNVWEWCWDWQGSYPSSPQFCTTGPSSGTERIIRGGSYYGYQEYCRNAFRFQNPPYDTLPVQNSYYDGYIGLRIGRTALVSEPCVSVVSCDEKSAVLSWIAPSYTPSGFRIYYSTSADPRTAVLYGSVSSSPCAVYGLSSGTSYFFWVCAYSSGGQESVRRNAVSTVTKLAVPTGLVQTGVSGDSYVTVSWEGQNSVLSYNVYCGTDPAADAIPLYGSTSYPSITIAQLAAETTYYIRISAVNDGGETAKSSVFAVTTAPVSSDTFVLVEGGSFSMGKTGVSEPVHTVYLYDFYISKYEVTQSEWSAVMGSNPSYFFHGPWNGENQARRPVERMSWYQSLVYCNKRSIAEGLKPCYSIDGFTNTTMWGDVPTSADPAWDSVVCDRTANGYRLPTEAEWEYAARGGQYSCGFAYSGSNDSTAAGWVSENSYDNRYWGCTITHEIGKKLPNELGLYDMSGNVWEFCWDWADSYRSETASDPAGSSGGTCRIIRGGSFGDSSWNIFKRNTTFTPYNSADWAVGLRVVRSAARTAAQSVSLTLSETVLTPGSVIQFSAQVLPSDASMKNVVWCSSDEEAAIVSADGIVTACASLSEGETRTAVITATLISNPAIQTSCSVTVQNGISYTVQFDTQGGTELAPIRAAENSKIPQPTDPVRPGYVFTGWYTAAGGTTLGGTLWDFTSPITADAVIYAGWKKTSAVVDYDDSSVLTVSVSAATGSTVLTQSTVSGSGSGVYAVRKTSLENNIITFTASVLPLLQSGSYTYEWVLYGGTNGTELITGVLPVKQSAVCKCECSSLSGYYYLQLTVNKGKDNEETVTASLYIR